MNKKAEFTLQGMLIGILILGLFAGLIGTMIAFLGTGYDTTGFVEEDIEPYYTTGNLSSTIQSVRSEIDPATIDDSWFDFLSGIFNVVLEPFKFVYKSVDTLINLTGYVVSDLGLFEVFGQFLTTLLTILVIVGIVMIKFFMGRSK